ncbi:MAG: hypothetical protein FWE37_02100 [Spirochaetaceae bacterium]|nr:hypothetical protein [Spirochaetaceae bacterium]
MLKKITLILLLFLTTALWAQQNLAVNTRHPVYSLIDTAEARGLVTRLTQVRPYTRRQISLLLAEIDSKRYQLTGREQAVLDFYIEEFSAFVRQDNTGGEQLLLGRLDFFGQRSWASLGVTIGLDFRVAAENLSASYMAIPFQLYGRGDFLDGMISYNADLIFVGSRLNPFPFARPAFFVPRGMGFHQGVGSDDAGLGGSDELTVGYEMSPEIAASLWDDRILIRLGMLDTRRVGHGSHGLNISDTAVPYNAFDMSVRPLNWFNFYTMTASLGYFATDAKSSGRGHYGLNQIDADPTGNPRWSNWSTSPGFVDMPTGGYYDSWVRNGFVQNNKMMAFQMGEFFMSDYFYFALFQSVVYGQRFELGYLNPLGFYFFSQLLYGENDNMFAGISAATIWPGVAKFWLELAADEVGSPTNLSHARNLYALQLGARVNLPSIQLLPFATLTFQYTKIEPYTYSHYFKQYNFNGTPNPDPHNPINSPHSIHTDTSFTNEGMAIATYLPANSDEFKLTLQTMPLPGLQLSLGWQLIRSGTNPKVLVNLWSDGWIRRVDDNPNRVSPNSGRQSEYQDRGLEVVDTFWYHDPSRINGGLGATYPYHGGLRPPRKNFLFDGIYQFNNIFSFGLNYDLRAVSSSRRIPMVVNMQYQFSHNSFNLNGINPDGYYAREVASGSDDLVWFPTIGRTGGYNPFSRNIFSLNVTVFPR